MPTELPDTMSLAIAATARIAEDIHLFELRARAGELPAFTAGSHIGVRAPNGQRRNYSLCNDPQERDHYVIAVKRELLGRGGSMSLIDDTRVGDELAVSLPKNDFALKPNPAGYIFIAGGIGITPIRSMISSLMSAGGPPFKLYYFSRTPEMMAFREELGRPELRGRVVMHHDGGDPARAFDLWPVLEKPKGAHLYCCGPRGLMEAVRDMTGHWSSSSVHFEDFGTGSEVVHPDDHPFNVRLARSGDVLEVPAGASILEVLRANGCQVASSCESGTCGTCRTGLLAGEADHRDLVLSDQERARAIMVCVSRAKSPELVLDL
jgi:phthalate 4,5-dioxygenase reductase subunit